MYKVFSLFQSCIKALLIPKHKDKARGFKKDGIAKGKSGIFLIETKINPFPLYPENIRLSHRLNMFSLRFFWLSNNSAISTSANCGTPRRTPLVRNFRSIALTLLALTNVNATPDFVSTTPPLSGTTPLGHATTLMNVSKVKVSPFK